MPISFIPYTAVYGPLSIPGVSCSLWLDAADPTQISFSSSTNVSTWNDKSGFRNSCSNQSLSTTITYPGTQVNGLNTVNFTAGCIRGAFNGSSVINTTDVSIFIVTAETAPNNNLRMFSLTTAANYQDDTANTMLVYCAPGNYQLTFYRGGVMPTPYTVTQNVPFIYSLTQTSGTGSMWLNGGSNVSASITNSNFAVTNYNIGTLYLANQNYTGLMCEVLVYNSLLSTPQRQAIEGYLAQKWGLTSQLPAGHPGLSKTLYNGKVYQPQISLKPAPYANYFPLSVAGCAFWLDAADLTTMTFNGSAIIQWNDKSPSSNYVSQATVANAPTLGTSQNGLNTVYFATTNQQLVSSQNSPTPGNASRTVIALFWCPTLSSAYYSVTGTESLGNPAPAWGMAKNANADVDYPFMYSSAGYDQYTFVYSTPNPLLTYAQYDSGASFFSGYYATAGATGGTTTVGNFATRSMTFNTTAGVWYIGRRQQAATGSVTSHLLEMIQYTRALTTAERQQVEGYLAWKWGLTNLLPLTHPYYSAPPLQYTRGAILPPPTLNVFGRVPYASMTPYYNVSPQTWLSVWQPYLQELVAANSGATASLSSTGASVTSTNTGAAIIAPNGNIYYSVVGSSISYYNPTTNAVNSIALGQAIDSPSAVLGADGNMYMYPTNANTGQNIIKITTSNNTASTISAGTNGWWGMILAPNGNIYGIPARTMTNVLVLNTTTGTRTTITGTTNGYWGGVLAPNGKIYCIPGPSVAIIDPVAGTITPNAVSGSGQANGYFGGVLGWDGNIYCIPSGTTVGVINPNTNTFTTFASNSVFYSGGCLGPDGKIYCIPRSGGAIGVINIATQSFSASSLSLPTGATYNGATLAPSGIIYVSPYTSGSLIYKITFSGLSLSPYLNLCLTPYINKF